ncbi:MAG: NAD-dependent epimerase/dehydratase family protein [Rikenellaceae bacterium]
MNNRRVLVTGANGMLATNIVEELIAQGYCVRGLLRKRESYRGVMDPILELMEGDFCDLRTIERAVADCDGVIHSAAITNQNLLDYKEYRRVNVDATQQLLRVAIEAKVSRFLHVSTANTIGFGTPQSPADESRPMADVFIGSMYARSKKEAEDVALSCRDLIDVVVVNPTFMVGRYGSSSGSNKMLAMVKPTVVATTGGKSFIDVVEVARGCVAALWGGVSGERYLISGENLSYEEFFRRFTTVRRVIIIPRFITRAVGVVGDALRFLGVEASFSSANLRMLTTRVCYSNQKLSRELGFTPRGLADSEIMK